MKFPVVSRDRYDDTKAMLEKRIADLEDERKKLWDVIAYNGIHMTIFNKELIPQAAPEPELTPEQKAEADAEQIERDEVALIASTRRTRPSLLPRVMERVMQARGVRAAAAALPPKVRPEVQQIFDKAKSTVTH